MVRSTIGRGRPNRSVTVLDTNLRVIARVEGHRCQVPVADLTPRSTDSGLGAVSSASCWPTQAESDRQGAVRYTVLAAELGQGKHTVPVHLGLNAQGVG